MSDYIPIIGTGSDGHNISLRHLCERRTIDRMSIPQRDGPGGPCPNRVKNRRVAEWCPYCYVNIRGRERFKGHIGYHAVVTGYIPWENYVMKKPDMATTKATSAGGACPCPLLAKFASICEYLTTTSWEDGSVRMPSKLSLCVEDGFILIALNDVDLKQSAYTSSTSLQEGLKLLDAALKGSQVTWRPWKSGKGRK